MSDRLRMIEQMIAKGSVDPFHHYARAMELRSLGQTQEALTAFASVRDRFPDYVPTYLMAAQLAQEAGERAQALSWAESGMAKAKAKGDDHALSELKQLCDLLESSP